MRALTGVDTDRLPEENAAALPLNWGSPNWFWETIGWALSTFPVMRRSCETC